jgi:YD repeat-containing protein
MGLCAHSTNNPKQKPKPRLGKNQAAFFFYDTDRQDPNNNYNFLLNGWGRLTSVEWYALGYRIIERYSYFASGLVYKKRLHVTSGTNWPTTAGAALLPTDYYVEAIYGYNNEGQTVSVTYPGATGSSGPGATYTYSFDSLGRPNKLTDNQATPIDWVKDVLYAPSGQMTQIKFVDTDIVSPPRYFTETRSYNARQQLGQILATNFQGTTSFNMQYVYSATQNNGQISQAIDAVSGETVDYAYDSLNRLITAVTTGPQWGLSFGYDGFGNRLNQTVTKGSGPASSISVNASTNRISSSGYVYDSNGNMTTMPYGAGSMTLTYDIDNRLTRAVNSNGTEYYGYSADNRRVFQRLASGGDLIHFYGMLAD